MPRLLILLCALACLPLMAAEPTPWAGTQVVFQYAVPVVQPERKVPATAYLWVPPDAAKLRGIVIGGTVLFEGSFAAHPAIRAACAKAGLGIVLFSGHLDAMFNAEKSAEPLQKALDDLAAAAHHPEISQAPLLPYGHSVGTIWTRNVLFWKPQRCFGALFFKGGFSIPDGHTIDEITGIPLFHVQGRFEEFGPASDGNLRRDLGEDRSTGGRTAMRDLGALRAAHADFLMGLAVEDGSTHFAMNDAVATLLADYVAGAAALRIAPDGSLRKVEAAAGALSASGDLFAVPAQPAAAYASYAGDRAATFWHVSLELAQQVEAFEARFRGRAPQYVSLANAKGEPIAVGTDMRLRMPQVTWVGPDVVEVKGAFWDKVPDKYPPQEGAVTHAEGPILARIFAGPLEQVAPDRFRLTMDYRLGERPFVLVYHPGDEKHRAAEQPVLLMKAPTRRDGKDFAAQTITFEAPESVAAAGLPLALKASSSSGLPVQCFVDHGPARVRDGKLELADVPADAVWPLQLTVVATQYGSAVAPKTASAEPVRRLIQVTR